MVFDIMLSGVSDGTITYHTSIAPPKAIKPCFLRVPGPNVSEYVYKPCELCILAYTIFIHFIFYSNNKMYLFFKIKIVL